MGKRKLDIASGSHAAKKRSVFRMAHQPSRATSTSTTTILRKGSSGRRGHRKEQLSEFRPGSSIDPDVPSDDTPLPDPEILVELDKIQPKAEKPKRVRKNTTSVSILLRIHLNLKLKIARQTFLNGSPFGKVAWRNYFVTTATATSLASNFAFLARRSRASTNAWTVLVGAFCVVVNVLSSLTVTTHFTVST